MDAARHLTPTSLLLGLLLTACASQPLPEQPPDDVESAFRRAFPLVTCGGPPGFDPELLERPGDAERGDGPIAATLRSALVEAEGDVLPDAGWIEVARSDEMVKFIASGGRGPGLAIVTIQQNDGQWLPDGSGRCDVLPDVREGLDLAKFRVAPGEELSRETREVDVLVLEMRCNSGEDAADRIVEPTVVAGDDAVIVVFATVPRGGAHDCQANPETPSVLVLPEPLGDRVLLDGSEIPARDATECHARVCG